VSVVIRLQRAGGRNAPTYRVVACDSRRARDGRFIEKVGYYNPLKDPAEIQLEVPRIEDWIAKGARLSDTVALLLKRFRLQMGDVATQGSSRGVEAT
jgi:small subunit ribosomal protein S16